MNNRRVVLAFLVAPLVAPLTAFVYLIVFGDVTSPGIIGGEIPSVARFLTLLLFSIVLGAWPAYFVTVLFGLPIYIYVRFRWGLSFWPITIGVTLSPIMALWVTTIVGNFRSYKFSPYSDESLDINYRLLKYIWYSFDASIFLLSIWTGVLGFIVGLVFWHLHKVDK